MKAVALDLDGFTGGGQNASATSPTPSACTRRRKPVIAYGVGYTDDSYQLASAASEIWLNPLGLGPGRRPGGSNLYYKGLLDKLGVTANVYRVGTYKSAVEPFIRNDMSPEAQAELHGARPGRARKLARRRSSRRVPRRTSTCSSAT